MIRYLLAAAALLVACAKPWPHVEPVASAPIAVASNEWRSTDQVVLITDASGTMTKDALLPEARAISQSFVAAMPEPSARAERPGSYEASLVGFGGSERITTEHGPVDRAALYEAASSLRPLGAPAPRTPMAAAIDEAAASLQGKRGRAAVVIVGDGRADDPAKALAAGQSLVSGYPDQLCIHTVHSGDSAEGRDLLAKLAALSKNGCGSTREASSLDNLAAMKDMERKVFLTAAPLPDVAANACSGRVVLRGVTFDFDKSTLRSESGPVLEAAAEQLRACPNLAISVEGHTCSLGPDAYNSALSTRRATTVREYLVEHGVSPERLTAVGRGKADPVATNDTKDGRAQNRRVELVTAQ